MATEKTINSRIQLKHDTETNWNLAAENSNFIPKIAEPIMYDIDENHPRKRFKIGDGKTNVKDLEFIEQIQSDWNQNDSEADDYIKNRTHWIDKDGVVHLIDEKFIPDAIARTTQIPVALKNPEALIINGVAYNGSKVVDILTPRTFCAELTQDDDGNYSTNSNFLILTELAAQGYSIYCKVDGSLVPMIGTSDDVIDFAITLAAGDFFLTYLIGIFNDNSVTVEIIETVALPNPNALTINGVSYDGSEAVDITEQVNAMIDAKLGVIENGAY